MRILSAWQVNGKVFAVFGAFFVLVALLLALNAVALFGKPFALFFAALIGLLLFGAFLFVRILFVRPGMHEGE